MATKGSRIPKVKKIDANAGTRKVASALNTVSKVLRKADLILLFGMQFLCKGDVRMEQEKISARWSLRPPATTIVARTFAS